jgi:radical SAM protein with 4Fe4S-binding SPASM domain
MPLYMTSKPPDLKIRTLILVLTKKCNLKCRYCYEKSNLRDSQSMDVKIAKEMISRYMEEGDEFNGVEIEFFGGEPMLEFPLIKETVEWFYSRKWPKPHRFLIGTNGTILTDEMKNWLYKYSKLLTMALSIDGIKTAHNITRDNSYDLVYPNIPFFVENWPSQAVKMTFIGDTIPYIADSIIQFEEMGINFTANIAFEDFWGSPERKKELLEIYEEQLSRLVDYYEANPELHPVSPMLTSLPEYLALPSFTDSMNRYNDCTRFCGAGHEMVAVDVDGNTYPCHRFLPWVSGCAPPEHPINLQTSWQPDKCANCKLIHSCPTCAGFNWEKNNDTGHRTYYHCEAFKLEVLASAQLEAIRLAKKTDSELKTMSNKEAKSVKRRVEAIRELLENGIPWDL